MAQTAMGSSRLQKGRFTAVILSESEESATAHFHEHTRFFVGPQGGTLRMTAPISFSAAC